MAQIRGSKISMPNTLMRFVITSYSIHYTKLYEPLNTIKVLGSPTCAPPNMAIKRSMMGVNTTPPNPSAETMSPVTKPFFSGNHFWEQAMVVEYVKPLPIPPMAPYPSHSSHGLLDVTKEARKNPPLRIIPPIITITLVENLAASLPPMTLPMVRVASNRENVRLAAALSPLKMLFAIPV